MWYLPVGILLFAVYFAGGCSSSQSDQQAISEILNIRTVALNTRDVTPYIAILSNNYNHNEKKFSHLKESLINNFKTIESLTYQPGKPTISLHGKYAEATGTYRMKILIHGKEIVLDGNENIKLAKESEGWKITGGL